MDSRDRRFEPDAPSPLPDGWCRDLYADDFTPPQSGWPPQAVFGPDAVRRHIEKSEQLRRARAARSGNGENAPAGVSESGRAILRLSFRVILSL
jgi:hypothetical protein